MLSDTPHRPSAEKASSLLRGMKPQAQQERDRETWDLAQAPTPTVNLAGNRGRPGLDSGSELYNLRPAPSILLASVSSSVKWENIPSLTGSCDD